MGLVTSFSSLKKEDIEAQLNAQKAQYQSQLTTLQSDVEKLEKEYKTEKDVDKKTEIRKTIETKQKEIKELQTKINNMERKPGLHLMKNHSLDMAKNEITSITNSNAVDNKSTTDGFDGAGVGEDAGLENYIELNEGNLKGPLAEFLEKVSSFFGPNTLTPETTDVTNKTTDVTENLTNRINENLEKDFSYVEDDGSTTSTVPDSVSITAKYEEEIGKLKAELSGRGSGIGYLKFKLSTAEANYAKETDATKKAEYQKEIDTLKADIERLQSEQTEAQSKLDAIEKEYAEYNRNLAQSSVSKNDSVGTYIEITAEERAKLDKANEEAEAKILEYAKLTDQELSSKMNNINSQMAGLEAEEDELDNKYVNKEITSSEYESQLRVLVDRENALYEDLMTVQSAIAYKSEEKIIETMTDSQKAELESINNKTTALAEQASVTSQRMLDLAKNAVEISNAYNNGEITKDQYNAEMDKIEVQDKELQSIIENINKELEPLQAKIDEIFANAGETVSKNDSVGTYVDITPEERAKLDKENEIEYAKLTDQELSSKLRAIESQLGGIYSGISNVTAELNDLLSRKKSGENISDSAIAELESAWNSLESQARSLEQDKMNLEAAKTYKNANSVTGDVDKHGDIIQEIRAEIDKNLPNGTLEEKQRYILHKIYDLESNSENIDETFSIIKAYVDIYNENSDMAGDQSLNNENGNPLPSRIDVSLPDDNAGETDVTGDIWDYKAQQRDISNTSDTPDIPVTPTATTGGTTSTDNLTEAEKRALEKMKEIGETLTNVGSGVTTSSGITTKKSSSTGATTTDKTDDDKTTTSSTTNVTASTVKSSTKSEKTKTNIFTRAAEKIKSGDVEDVIDALKAKGITNTYNNARKVADAADVDITRSKYNKAMAGSDTTEVVDSRIKKKLDDDKNQGFSMKF